MKSSVNATLVLNGLRVKVAMIKNSTVVCIQLKQSVSKCSLWQSKGTLREQLKCIVHYIKILSRLARNSFPPNWTRAVSPSQLVELVKARGWSIDNFCNFSESKHCMAVHTSSMSVSWHFDSVHENNNHLKRKRRTGVPRQSKSCTRWSAMRLASWPLLRFAKRRIILRQPISLFPMELIPLDTQSYLTAHGHWLRRNQGHFPRGQRNSMRISKDATSETRRPLGSIFYGDPWDRLINHRLAFTCGKGARPTHKARAATWVIVPRFRSVPYDRLFFQGKQHTGKP